MACLLRGVTGRHVLTRAAMAPSSARASASSTAGRREPTVPETTATPRPAMTPNAQVRRSFHEIQMYVFFRNIFAPSSTGIH